MKQFDNCSKSFFSITEPPKTIECIKKDQGCKKKFSTKLDAIAHQRTCEAGATINFRCPTCDKGFKTVSLLRNHLDQNPMKTCLRILG